MVKIKICGRIVLRLQKLLFILLLTPVVCFSQKENAITWQLGAGYLFYPGSASEVHLPVNDPDNPLKSGFTLEAVADKRLNSFLYLGLGSSFNSFSHLGAPYIPVFADIRVVGVGKFKLFSFLNPGYGIFHHDYDVPAFSTQGRLTGGFFIAYGFGVNYKIFYLQAKYNWFRFSLDPADASVQKSSKAYGVAGLSFGVRIP